MGRCLALSSHTFTGQSCDGLQHATTLHVKHRQGSDNTAIELSERALSIRTKELGKRHEDTIDTQNFLERVRQKVHERERVEYARTPHTTSKGIALPHFGVLGKSARERSKTTLASLSKGLLQRRNDKRQSAPLCVFRVMLIRTSQVLVVQREPDNSLHMQFFPVEKKDMLIRHLSAIVAFGNGGCLPSNPLTKFIVRLIVVCVVRQVLPRGKTCPLAQEHHDKTATPTATALNESVGRSTASSLHGNTARIFEAPPLKIQRGVCLKSATTPAKHLQQLVLEAPQQIFVINSHREVRPPRWRRAGKRRTAAPRTHTTQPPT